MNRFIRAISRVHVRARSLDVSLISSKFAFWVVSYVAHVRTHHHRMHGNFTNHTRTALEEELALCAQFLELDGRNFHCWAHRMWVAERMGLSAEENYDFTTTKIKQVCSDAAVGGSSTPKGARCRVRVALYIQRSGCAALWGYFLGPLGVFEGVRGPLYCCIVSSIRAAVAIQAQGIVRVSRTILPIVIVFYLFVRVFP